MSSQYSITPSLHHSRSFKIPLSLPARHHLVKLPLLGASKVQVMLNDFLAKCLPR
jgi:hypothetical protein